VAQAVAEFIAFVAASKDSVPCGTAGTGNIIHRAAELFVQSSGANKLCHSRTRAAAGSSPT